MRGMRAFWELWENRTPGKINSFLYVIRYNMPQSAEEINEGCLFQTDALTSAGMGSSFE